MTKASQTEYVRLSDAVIARYAAKSCRQLKDEARGVLFRYRADRSKGSFFVRVYQDGGEVWRKLGGYPEITTDHVLANVSKVRAKLRISVVEPVRLDVFETVGPLLAWFSDRSQKIVSLSASRKATIKSVVSSRLLPYLDDVPVLELASVLDDRLMLPLQSHVSTSYLKSIFGVLKRALNQAAALGCIASNPLGGVVFSHFIQDTPKEKPARLSPASVIDAVNALPLIMGLGRLLPLLMLLFGTRINETRLFRWEWIDWRSSLATIPHTVTKTGEGFDIPLTPIAVQILKDYQAFQNQKGGSVWLFPSPMRRGRPIGKTKAGEVFRSVSGGEWSSHDLRKVARQIWTLNGVDYYVGERLLNHRMSSLDRVYNRSELNDKKREALNAYHDFLVSRGAWLLTETETRQGPTVDHCQAQTPRGLTYEAATQS